MTPWLKRQIADTGEPCTHALVVGISRYDYLPLESEMDDEASFGLEQLTSTASSALRFAEWLRDEYNQPDAPLGTIRLLLSASDAEKQVTNSHIAAVEGMVPKPTADNVENALKAWYLDSLNNRDHVAILYISGHGIQNSKEGGIVLLQDFRHPDDIQLLKRAIDVEGVREGMSRAQNARRQFYFVDSCRTRPELLKEFYSTSAGITLDIPTDGSPDVSAVYFGTSSGEPALGIPGNGTLFGYALLECLRGVAWSSSVDGTWTVRHSDLVRTLDSQVSKLAADYGERQSAKIGGVQIDTVFHVVQGNPDVVLTICLEPPKAAERATADLSDNYTEEWIFQNAFFDSELSKPSLTCRIPPGVYLLRVTIKPPNDKYRNRTCAIIAEPPSKTESILVLR